MAQAALCLLASQGSVAFSSMSCDFFCAIIHSLVQFAMPCFPAADLLTCIFHLI